MEQFLTWSALTTYASFVSIVFMIVEFTKELEFIKKIQLLEHLNLKILCYIF